MLSELLATLDQRAPGENKFLSQGQPALSDWQGHQARNTAEKVLVWGTLPTTQSVLLQSRNKKQNFQYRLELSLKTESLLEGKLEKKNQTSAFWGLLYSGWSTDLLIRQVQEV